MAATPTTTEIIVEYAKIEQFIADEVTLAEHISTALADVKRYLLNNRGIQWSTVFDSDADDYYVDSDGVANNDDQLKKAISLRTVSLVYKANAERANVNQSNDSFFWDLYRKYRSEAETLLDVAKLDIDADKSGSISDDEERTTAQVFFSR